MILRVGIITLFAAALSLSACGQREGVTKREISNQLPYRAKLKAPRKSREFEVTVRARGASLQQVRESARYPATEHCLKRYGVSDVDWDLDPVSGDWRIQRFSSGDLVVSGRCTGRA